MDCPAPPSAAADLFPELAEKIKDAGPNSLTEGERQKLVVAVIPWCRKLAREHADHIRRTGRRVETEDLEAEAFVAASEAAQYFDPRRGCQFTTFVKPWVQTHLIAKTDLRYQVEAAGMEYPDRQPDRADGPEEIEPAGPTAAELRILGNLPEPTRTVVRLSVFDRLSPGRIADQLGMALKDVRLHLRNAAGRLGKVADGDNAVGAMLAASGN
jgi:RNA polymerase sigma factor (sigma-70 family)